MNVDVLTIEALRSRIASQVDSLKATLLDDSAALHRGYLAKLGQQVEAQRREQEAAVAAVRAQLADAEAARDKYWSIVLDLRVRLNIARAGLQNVIAALAAGDARGLATTCAAALRNSAEGGPNAKTEKPSIATGDPLAQPTTNQAGDQTNK